MYDFYDYCAVTTVLLLFLYKTHRYFFRAPTCSMSNILFPIVFVKILPTIGFIHGRPVFATPFPGRERDNGNLECGGSWSHTVCPGGSGSNDSNHYCHLPAMRKKKKRRRKKIKIFASPCYSNAPDAPHDTELSSTTTVSSSAPLSSLPARPRFILESGEIYRTSSSPPTRTTISSTSTVSAPNVASSANTAREDEDQLILCVSPEDTQF